MAQRPKLTILGKLMIFLFVAVCFYGAYSIFFTKDFINKEDEITKDKNKDNIHDNANVNANAIKIGIAYGTEKRLWLEWAANQFAKTDDAKRVQVELIPLGSQEGARAVLEGDQSIHVWAPASSLYQDVFIRDWQAKYGEDSPLLEQETLALTPMVMVIWADRYQAFMLNYKTVDFNTLFDALQLPTGWRAIANKPEWGLFKFGHTHPLESNSGLITLVLMAYDFHKKCRQLEVSDLMDANFQNWLRSFSRSISGLSNSSGNLMKDMVLKGPSVYDALFVYENLAIDYLKSAQGRWGDFYIHYPERNLWSDNPYYILKTPWTTKKHHEAARLFLKFLLSESVQKQALIHGFRPGNPTVPINEPDSPFMQYRSAGLSIDLNQVCQAPPAEILENLMRTWERSR